jgi:hypothetical protein
LRLSSATTESNIFTRRNITRSEAEEEIRSLFANGGVHYISEVANELNLPDYLVVEICEELQSEGELRIHDDPIPSE